METVSTPKSLLVLIGGLVAGVGLGLILVLVCGVGGYVVGLRASAQDADPPANPSTVLAIGSPVPEFALVALNGQQVKINELRGYPIMINFWASWCGPCVAEMPLIQDRYDQYGSRLVILAINADEPRSDVLDFVNDNGLTFSILLDPNGSVQSLYHIRAYPTSFFVDAEGILQAEHIGTLSATQIDQYLGMIGVGK